MKKLRNIIVIILLFFAISFIGIYIYWYRTAPNPIKIVKSYFQAKKHCALFEDFLNNIRQNEWDIIEKKILMEKGFIEVKDQKIICFGYDYTSRLKKARVSFIRTFDINLPCYDFDRKSYKIIFHSSCISYAIIEDGKITRIKIP